MSLIGSSSNESQVETELPDCVIERLHYQSKFHDRKRAFQNGSPEVSVDIDYSGDELTPDQVRLTENYLAFILYDEVPTKYFSMAER